MAEMEQAPRREKQEVEGLTWRQIMLVCGGPWKLFGFILGKMGVIAEFETGADDVVSSS